MYVIQTKRCNQDVRYHNQTSTTDSEHYKQNNETASEDYKQNATTDRYSE